MVALKFSQTNWMQRRRWILFNEIQTQILHLVESLLMYIWVTEKDQTCEKIEDFFTAVVVKDFEQNF